MPQLIQPGLLGPGTADVLDGYLYAFEGVSSQNAPATLGACVSMPGYVGIQGTFTTLREAMKAAGMGGGAFCGARTVVRYQPTVYEAVKAALVETERLGWHVLGLRLHPGFWSFSSISWARHWKRFAV
jgi:hypothetical protein